MPHEYMYRHTRSHYAHVPGAGWSRAKIRYRTHGLWLDHWSWKLSGCGTSTVRLSSLTAVALRPMHVRLESLTYHSHKEA